MSETTISVTEAAKDLLRVLAMIEERHEIAILVRNGQAVAKLTPILRPATTCEELAERWPELDRLPQDEAEAFAQDVESARARLLPLRSAWD
jgi:antitoxin (DNA-binding transcriptional repressor) of toxin-antitoxin stability system